MEKILPISIIVFSIYLQGCQKQFDPQKIAGLKVAYADRSDKDVEVPKRLVGEVEALYLEEYKKNNTINTKDDGLILTNIPRSFLSFDIFLLPNANKLALSDALHFSFPRGGGVIDLKKFVVGDAGSFKLIIRLHQEDQGLSEDDLARVNVYFMSNAKRRQLTNETYGAGCNKYLKLSKYYHKELKSTGIELNATEARHISVVGGSFYFFLVKDDVLHLGSTSFEDSRYPDLKCKT